MKKSLAKTIQELRLHWKNYLFQSLAASLSIYIVLLILTTHEAVIVASIGATTFIVFAMPDSVPARAFNVIGGHLAGIAVGCLSAWLAQQMMPALACALAVGLSMFVMVVTDTEHPPASGTALGIALHGFSFSTTSTILASSVVLALIHYFARRYLRNLV